jgi:hypothetical protein
MEGPVNYSYTNWPPQGVPTNNFSVRWSGFIEPLISSSHIFYVSNNAGAGFRFKLINQRTEEILISIDNWNNPSPNAVEMRGTNVISPGYDHYIISLEYKNTTGAPQVALSWMEQGGSKSVIASNRFVQLGITPTGLSVDAEGKPWVGSRDSDNVMRINPKGGDVVVTNGATNYVGAVDMVVNLGDGNGHEEAYAFPAAPYNYSDMTGLNNQIVNPSLLPLKGYWQVIHDSGISNLTWNLIAWNAGLTNGSSIDLFVRAGENRQTISTNTVFLPVSNSMPLTNIVGRYIELRLGVIRQGVTNFVSLEDLTLYGTKP